MQRFYHDLGKVHNGLKSINGAPASTLYRKSAKAILTVAQPQGIVNQSGKI